MSERIGILTSGDDCAGLNAVMGPVVKAAVIVSTLALLLSPAGSAAGPGALVVDFPREFPLKQHRFDIGTDKGLTKLVAAAEMLVELSDRQEEQMKSDRKQMAAAKPLAEMSVAELRKYFWPPEDLITKRDRRGLREIRRLASAALETHDAALRSHFLEQICEMGAAVRNSHRSPVPSHLDFVQVPVRFFDQLHNPVARGRSPAANLDPDTGGKNDLSRLDPQPSTFWQRPDSVSGRDLYHGFGRTELPRFEDWICNYAGPKTSYGSNPGFEVVCGGRKIKVKFGETTSEPFAARVFWALGYHVDPTDHAERLKIRYDRRLFREFHLRKEIRIRCTILGVLPVYNIKLQRRFDPFDYIAFAAMRDGSRLSGAELKQKLFFRPPAKHPEDSHGNFRPEVEEQIDYLVTVPANVQIEDERSESIGPWDFGQLGHERLRELRGAGLLAAWLGWFDSRFENTRLRLIETREGLQLAHYFSDIGGGLGRGKSYFSPHGERPNEFGWSFTRRTRSSDGRASFRIVDFKPIDDTPAFAEMTVDDARWMARLIGQLTEEQIVQALVASGFDSAQVKLYAEKLVCRRDRMIHDLDLAGEIAPLRPGGANRNLSYDENTDGPVTVRLPGGSTVTAKSGSTVVKDGRLVTIEEARGDSARSIRIGQRFELSAGAAGGIQVDSRRD